MQKSEIFRTHLTEAMREQTLTPSELARRMKTNPSTVLRWVAGSLPHVRTLEPLQKILRRPLVDPPHLGHALSPDSTKSNPAELTDWEVALQSIPLLGRPNTWALVDRALSRIEAQPHTLTKGLPPLWMLLFCLKAGEAI